MTPTRNFNGIAVAKQTAQVKNEILAYSDSPSAVSLVTITVNLNERRPSFGELRGAVELVSDILNNEVRQEYSPSPYDCTGQSFTSGLDRINWFTYDTGNELLLIAIYKHYISVDC